MITVLEISSTLNKALQEYAEDQPKENRGLLDTINDLEEKNADLQARNADLHKKWQTAVQATSQTVASLRTLEESNRQQACQLKAVQTAYDNLQAELSGFAEKHLKKPFQAKASTSASDTHPSPGVEKRECSSAMSQ